MASGSTIIIVGGLALAAGAYFLGYLCPYGLCPPNSAPRGTRGLGPSIPQEGDIPINDITWRTNNKHDSLGYGDYYESNQAHISIA